jgi:hypothetical protein
VTIEDQWAALFDAMGRPGDAEDQAAALRTAMSLGLTVAPSSVGCSVTEVVGAGFQTPVASGDLAMALDHAQYADNAGPCVAAALEHQIHRLDAVDGQSQYRSFGAAAAHHQVRSSLSVPLAGSYRPAALNLYARTTSAFDNPQSMAVADLLSRCVADFLRSGPDGQGSVAHAEEQDRLARARRGHDVVVAAQNVVAERDGVTLDDAYTVLIGMSRRGQQSIIEVARAVVGSSESDSRRGGL